MLINPYSIRSMNPDPGWPTSPQKKENKFHVWKAACSPWKAGGFSWSTYFLQGLESIFKYSNTEISSVYLPLIIQPGVLVHPARLDPLDEQARRLLPSVLLVQESRLQKVESMIHHKLTLNNITAVFRIRIHMFLGLPVSDLLVWIRILLSSSKTSKKNLDSSCFVTSFGLFIFEKWCKCTLKKKYAEKLFFKLVFC